MSAHKASLRAHYQALRSSLDRSARSALDRRIAQHVLDCCSGKTFDRIAAFLAFRGEPDLTHALQSIHRRGHRIYVPVIGEHEMQFMAWTPDSTFALNRFGIAEPVEGEICSAQQLDRVLMPLLAFDADGRRLGMGGGYYDRCFAFKREMKTSAPRMTGIAYSIQQHKESAGLPDDPWDVPLDEVITEQGLVRFIQP